MQNRKDLLQAHRLMTQRAGQALMQGEPDTAEQPLRRINVATFAGLMVAALIVAAFWIIGVFTHSGGQLERNASDTVIIDKDTGTSYIWCDGGRLCPTVNYASALLALNAANPHVRAVSQELLANYPQGQLIGIPGLPAPPVPGRLIHGPWSVCVQTSITSTGPQRLVTLVAGRSVGGHPVGESRSLLVRAQGQTWLVWHDQRMAITKRYVVGTGLGGQPAVAVPAAWLNSITEGPAFTPPHIAGFGQPTARGPHGTATIGEVYKVVGVTKTQWYVQLSDGLAEISETQAALLNVAPGQNVSQQQLSSHVVAQHVSARTVPGQGLPPVPPAPVSYDAATPLCAVYYGAGQPGQVTVNGTVPAHGLPALGAGGVNYVWLPPAAGALAGVTSTGGQHTASTYFLVTRARRYPLASRAVAADFGYTLAAQRTLVPANILSLIPQGPVLDPDRAKQTVIGG